MEAKLATQSNYYISTIEGLVTPDANAIYLVCEHLIQDKSSKYSSVPEFAKFKLENITLANLKFVKSCPSGSCMTNLAIGDNIDRLEHELLAL